MMEKQILRNQKIIMCVLRDVANGYNKEGYLGSLNREIEYTKKILEECD